MSNGPPPTRPQELRAFELVAEGAGMTFRDFRVVAGLGALPALMSVLWALVLGIGEVGPLHVSTIAYSLGELFLFSTFAVAWHRYILLRRRDTRASLQFWPSTRDFLYFVRLSLFLVPPQAVVVALAASRTPEESLGLLPLYLVAELGAMIGAGLFSLGFPAMAIDRFHGFAAARQALRGATPPLIGALAIVTVAATILTQALVVPLAAGGVSTLLGAVLHTLITLGYVAVVVAIVSIAYRRRVGT